MSSDDIGREHGLMCEGCGKRTVVTDVWIARLPVTLCQPCVLDALTAEGERLGRYWEIKARTWEEARRG